MSNACHAEREYPQDGGHGKKADGLLCTLNMVTHGAGHKWSDTPSGSAVKLMKFKISG